MLDPCNSVGQNHGVLNPFVARRRRRRNLRTVALRLLMSCGLLSCGLLSSASLADEFSNLEVLPKDIERRELMDTMKGYARSLGVRCHHCHVGEEGLPLTEFDFVSDAKANKDVARSMMRMTQQINASLSKIGRDPVLEVTCVSCHHGQARPLTLQQVLAETLAEDGLEATVARYRALRSEWFGRSTYDFGEATLRRLAEQVSRGEDGLPPSKDTAIAFLKLNLEHHPDAVRTLTALARLYRATDQDELATATYRQILRLDPDNLQAISALETSKP